MEKQINYIIPHTHWDREWRYPVWTTRKLLLEFMGQLLDVLDNDPDYQYFLLDGQVSPIEDFLQICPQERERVEKHIRDGKIGIGPWYTLPDLYPLDGECLLRNLNWGIERCKQYGEHLKIGYNSFGWGQTAQLPQIYADYGFDTIICAKKVSAERAPHAEFLWEAPDGTRVLTNRLGEFARANFFFHAYINTRYGLRFLSGEFSYRPEKAGFAVHNAGAAFADDDYFVVSPRKGHDFSYLKPGLADTFAANANTLCPQSQLLLSGCDFSTPQPDLGEIIRKANELYPGQEFVNKPLEQYTADLHRHIDVKSLTVVKGELRDGPSCDCSGNALASRIYLKQLNKKAQNQILRRAEPLCAVASMTGVAAYPQGFLWQAWKYMLDSHSHDAINGVTQDKTADDVEYRLNQALELGRVAFDSAAEGILRNIDLADEDENAGFLCVFNTQAQDVCDVIPVVLDTPKDEHIWSVAVTDAAGRRMRVQERSRGEISAPVHDLDGRPWPFYADRHELYLDTGMIPALGYKVFKISPDVRYTPRHHYWYPMRKTKGDELCASANVLENCHLKVSVNPNGTFDLQDKGTDRRFEEMHYFEDTGDVGSYWAYYPPYRNRTFTTLSSAPRIWLEDNGPLCAIIAVEHSLVLPAYGEEPLYGIAGKSERSEEEKTLKIVSRITLKRDARRVDIRTTVENNVRNHRLRVGFATGIATQSACSSGHFTVDERPVVSTRDADGAYWNEMQTLPMQDFVDVSDGKHGLSLLSNGIAEYEACEDEKRTVLLTLFRAMNNMIVTGWECVNRYSAQQGSQLLRTMEFEYAVYPHSGDWAEGNAYFEAKSLTCPPAAYQTMGARGGKLPRQYSFFSIEDKNLILSALKKADEGEGYVLRVYNPTNRPIRSGIRFEKPPVRVFTAGMRETRREAVDFDPDRIMIEVAAQKIVTLMLEF